MNFFSKRLGAAAAEMEYGEEEGNFDIIIVNDDLETAYVLIMLRGSKQVQIYQMISKFRLFNRMG